MIRFHQWLHHTHRALLYVCVGLLGLFLALWVAAQIWLMGQVEHYRDQLVQAVQQETGIAVRVGKLSAARLGWMPGIRLEQVQVLDAQGKPVLVMDEAEGRLSFSHLFLGRLDFGLLRVRHPVFTLIRKPGDQFYLSGLPLPKPDTGSDFVLQEIFGQNHIRIQNLEMTWVDETAQDVSGFTLGGDANLVNRGLRHELELGLEPRWNKTPTPLNLKFDLTGADLTRFSDWHGSLAVSRIESATVDHLLSTIALPRLPQEQWKSIDARGVLQNLQVFLDNREAQPLTRWSVDFDRVSMPGGARLPPLQNLSGHLEVGINDGSANLRGGLMPLQWLGIFSEPIATKQWSVRADWKREGEETRLKLQSLKFGNEELAGEVSGQLLLNGTVPGQASLHGQLDQLVPGAAWRYLPDSIPKATRQWLKQSLAGGMVRDFSLAIEGDLQQFPFPQDQGGSFRITSRLDQVGLHFHEAWPAIDGIEGTLEFHGTEMVVRAQHGHIGAVELYPVTARIPDLNSRDPQLLITGGARGDTQQMLDFIQKSPVAGYISHATDGFRGEGLGLLGLNLDIPLNHSIDSTVGGNYQFQNAALTQPEINLPPLTAVNGHLIFSEKGVRSEALEAQALGGKVSFNLQSQANGDVVLAADGAADMAKLASVYHEPILAYVSGTSPWQGHFLFRRRGMEMQVDAQALFLGEPATFQLVQAPGGGMEVRLWGKTSAQAVAQATHHALSSELRGNLDWRGKVQLVHGASTLNLNLAGELFGRPLKAVVTGSSKNWVVDATGAISADTLNQLGFVPGVGRSLKGVSEWKTHVEHQNDGDHITIMSGLEGMSLALPAPLAKGARERLPMTVRLDPAADNQARFRLIFNDRLTLELLASDTTAAALSHPLRGMVRLGNGNGNMPATGFLVAGNLRQASLDEWLKFLDELPAAGQRGRAQAWPEPLRLDLLAEDVRWKNRLWSSNRVVGTLEAGTWNLRFSGNEALGSLTWATRGDGQLTARFQRLVFPNALSDEGGGKSLAAQSTAHLPAVDLVAEHFTLRQHAMGRFQLVGRQENDLWKVQTLQLDLPGGKLRGDGSWSPARQEKSQFHVQLDCDNLGDSLTALGYEKMIARGKGKVDAQLSWPAAPGDFATQLLSGSLTLDLKDGQFLKVNPGGQGRLIGLLSLQELPRHLTLDFRDVFSDGYAFDHLVTHASLARGQMKIDDFVVASPSASVVMNGKLDLIKEQAHLSVLVNPSLGSGVSLLASIVSLPVGLISFAVQKILKNPLDSAFSYQYLIDGSWSNPQVRSVKVGTPLD
jgi:uncharacterized protein YhdP